MNELQHPEHNDNCLDQSILIARRDNELPADEVAQVEQHIATCGDCAANDRLITSGGRVGANPRSPVCNAPSTPARMFHAPPKGPAKLRRATPAPRSPVA